MIRSFWQARYGAGFPDRAAVDRHQARGMDRLRRRIMGRSPLYAPLADRPIEDWPLMDKSRMMRDFTAINTCGITLEQALDVATKAEESRDFSPMIGQIAVGLSTGTSGQRGLFLTNRRERATWAGVMLGRFWPQPLLRRQRIAFFLRANNALYETLGNALMQFRFYDLLDPFEGHIPRLAAQDPTVLIAPAQILCLLAGAQEARALRLRPCRIISVAEVLSPEDAALIRRAFGVPVDQVYQCTEGVLGYTCRAGSLHLNERFIRFDRDVIDLDTGAFCPVITDFTRESLPILRYRLDDVLVPDPAPCPCGCASVRLARIEGRADDILWWPAAQGGLRMIPSDAIRQAVALLPVPVRDYRAIQHGQRSLHVWLDTDRPTQAATDLRESLSRLAARHGCTLPALTLHSGLPVETAPKRRRVVALP